MKDDTELKPNPKQEHTPPWPPKQADGCSGFPDLRRPNYFFGQLLGPREFAGEQQYFRDKLRMAIRCLEGYGVVCGLVVGPVTPPRECDSHEHAQIEAMKAQLEKLLKAAEGGSADAAAKLVELRKRYEEAVKAHECREPAAPALVTVSCGLAYDCEGYELLLRETRTLDVWNLLSEADQKKYRDAITSTKKIPSLYLSVCRCEQQVEPVRPVTAGECGVTNDCKYGWTREGVSFRVSVDPPKDDERCETCCNGCCDEPAEPCGESRGESRGCSDCACLLLARIDDFRPGVAINGGAIHNGVRRPMAKYVPVAIKGVSWVHGATYTRDQANTILGSYDEDHKGLVIEFTRPVMAETITEGVLDVWTIEGGAGAAAQIKHLSGEYVDKPESGPITRLVYRRTADDAPDPGDRVLIQVRTNFILDACCRMVDGENAGGRVPLLDEFDERRDWDKNPKPAKVPCSSPPPGFAAPWHSGNGLEGGDFLSWFFVERGNKKHYKKEAE